MGQISKPSTTRANYFLTIVDDFSRAVWVYLIKHKSEASDCLMNFYKMVKTQFGKAIKKIRCDNGGEFVSNRMTSFYTQEGILLETTCPHTPQQNGVVERKHRHLLETTRALMFQASLPKKFWGECVLAASYIINCLPSKVTSNKTPYEIMFREKPDYSRMRILGCLAYYWSTETNGDKFEFRGRPGVFLGYPQGTKGYKIFDIEHGKMVISRDVRFVEGDFPFAKLKACNEHQEVFKVPEEDYGFYCDEPFVEPSRPNNKLPGNTEMGPSPNPELTFTGPGENVLGDTAPVCTSEGGHFHNQAQTLNQAQRSHDDLQHIQTSSPNEFLSATREKRNKRQPSYLKEFHVKLPPSIDHTQPASDQSSSTAMQDENWKLAMKKEIQALEQNKTWTLEELPEGKRAIDSKWVYKLKYKPNGEIERYKAHLVAKGYTQLEGIDFHETFAPVAKLVTVRTLLAVAVKKSWFIHQLDVNNAFLHGDLQEEVYMKIPQGFYKKGETRVCRLRKSLYGLRQASRNCLWRFLFTLMM
ncbi:putative RNA-directed DNA polymerase [Helianthus annuus]|nr:putative RNA-directed DNA polymerase [Helianthus annuus]